MRKFFAVLIACLFLLTGPALASSEVDTKNCLTDFISGRFFVAKSIWLPTHHSYANKLNPAIKEHLKKQGIKYIRGPLEAVETDIQMSVSPNFWGAGHGIYAARIEITFTWRCDYAVIVGGIAKININDFPSGDHEGWQAIVLQKALDSLFSKIPLKK